MRLGFRVFRKINKGFTLIEIVIVLAIASLLMSLVGPYTFKQLDKYSTSSEVLLLERTISLIESQAYIRMTALEVNFKDNSMFVVEVADKNLVLTEKFDNINFITKSFHISKLGISSIDTIEFKAASRNVKLPTNKHFKAIESDVDE